MHLAIATRADKNIRQMTDLTHPPMRAYAENCGADFLIYDHEPPLLTGDKLKHYRILRTKKMLKKYDRILHFDSDMLIRSDCPDLFKLTPEHKIATIFEDVGTRAKERRTRIKHIQEEWGDVGWKTGYSNAGTFLMSRMHKSILDPVNGEYWLPKGSVDVHLGYLIRKHKFEIYELPHSFNHMTMFSEKWSPQPDRFKSYIIHYAGKGLFEKNLKNRITQIANDAKEWGLL